MIPEVKILIGDLRERLREIPDEFFQSVVTSPPYWALRNYGTEPQLWGGDPKCRHEWECHTKIHRGGPPGNGEALALRDQTARADMGEFFPGASCVSCGAWRGELGQEPSPDLFVSHLVRDVFGQVRRVLKPDGVLWVVIGDSYVADAKNRSQDQIISRVKLMGGFGNQLAAARQFDRRGTGLKPKDLALIPCRFALGMQAAGWWIRQRVIWHKPNPMPESVTDRCTRAHEFVWMCSKRKRYFYDAEAIYEAALQPHGEPTCTGQEKRAKLQSLDSSTLGTNYGPEVRNKRDVWSVCTMPYNGAHYAVFPPDLVKPMILASTRPGDWVLDPFGGSGTVALVCAKYGRNATLIDLDPRNDPLMRERLAAAAGQGHLEI